MARQHNRPYEPEFASLTNSSNSPLSPPAGPDTPISFRTNVNRAKTKRWVEAKKASYDGNDWGEDEWDEYDDDSTPPVPQPPPNANQSTGDIPSMLSRDAARPPPIPAAMDRSRSMDHVATLGADSGPVSRGRSAERNLGETADRQAPIMRPADIYRRMQEQPQSGQEPSSWPNRPTEIPSGVGPPPSITTETVPNSHPLGREMSGDPLPHSSLSTAAEATSAQEKPSEGLSVQHDSFASRLPDVKRLSGFGADFFAGSAPSAQKDQTLESAQEQQLHHYPSFGYRSVVHQAFDVETPSTTVDSVERSNSGSTSAISPIIPSRAFGGEDEKTPTIVEEPESTSPPKDFKFGHRRDLSVPSPGNSPSRQPVFNNNDNIPTSSLAEVATHNPSGVHQDCPSSRPTDTYATPSQSPTHIPPGDRPSPLRITTQPAEESRANPESVPVIIPSLSTDDSPQDTESDRLRKDIIRSLSRENTPSDEPDQLDGSRPQTGRQDSLIPIEYERYWNDEASSTPQEQKLSVGYQPSQNNSQDLLASSAAPPSAPVPAAAPAEQGSRPQFKRRFSWESSSSDDLAAAPPVAGVQSPPGVDMPGQFPQTVEAPAPPTITVEQDPTDANRKSIQEKPKLTIITPAAMDSSSVSSDRVLPEVVDHPHREPTPYPENVQSADSEYQTPSLGPTAPPSIESNLLGFRDILGKKTSEERVEAFNQTRDQFASINTGLNHWIQVTVHAHPEHADVVGQSYSLSSAAPKPTMSRGKFPKLPSLGTFGTSEGSPSGSGHVRRPSAPLGSMMNKQQVEQRGKDLLHTAGVLGGKTGKAAKGLFAKGRSKFMGGNEKVEP